MFSLIFLRKALPTIQLEEMHLHSSEICVVGALKMPVNSKKNASNLALELMHKRLVIFDALWFPIPYIEVNSYLILILRGI
jgi:hypothetical protein